jgi:DNA ligase 4
VYGPCLLLILYYLYENLKWLKFYYISFKLGTLEFYVLFISDKMDEIDRCTVPFLRLCEFLEKLLSLKGKQKTAKLKKFFENSNVNNFFPIVRLMIPNYDMERGQYSLKETTLAKLYAELLSLPNKEKEALIYYKNPTKQIKGCPAGGFVEVLEFILSNRIGESKGLTVEDVNKQLDLLANSIDKNAKKKVLRELACSMNPLEQKWLVKIILKDMKLGTHDKILGAFHEKALEIFFHTNNLREVFVKLKDKTIDLGTQLYTLGQPIRPMLAGRKVYNDLKKLLINAEVYVETKFDGERIQCHYHIDGNFLLFSRNAVDYTAMYSKSLKNIIISNIHGLKACILDGELIVWDLENNCAGRFGQNKTVAIESTPGKTLCYKVFDIIYIETGDGVKHNLMPRPLSERKAILEKSITCVPNRLEIVKYSQVKGPKAVFELFNKAIEENEEGLIVKRADSPYIADDRSTLWMKLKSEYFEALSDTVDLLVVGGYYGSGFRAGGEDEFDHITVFLCAVSSKIELKDPAKSKFVPVTKVGTGYSIPELAEIRRHLRDQWKPFRQSPDYWPKWNPGHGERPDYYIKDPSKSLILELKAAEIVPSDKFPTNFTLRFPKVHKIRYDKNWDQSTTFSELSGIMENFSRGLTEKNAKIEEAHKEPGPIIRKKRKETLNKGDVMLAFRDTDTTNIIIKSEIFRNLEFYIAKSNDKQELEKLIVEYGGNKVQNYLNTTTHVIATDINSIRVQNLVSKRDIDIISPKWIYDCVKYSKRLDIKPSYMVSISLSTQSFFDREYTKYGDSLSSKYRDEYELLDLAMQIADQDVALIKRLMGSNWWESLPAEVLADIDAIPAYRFLGKVFYIHGAGLESPVYELQILSRHGTVSKEITPDVTHVLLLQPEFLCKGSWDCLTIEEFNRLLN